MKKIIIMASIAASFALAVSSLTLAEEERGWIVWSTPFPFGIENKQSSTAQAPLDFSNARALGAGSQRTVATFIVRIPAKGRWQVYIETPGGLGYSGVIDEKSPVDIIGKAPWRRLEYVTNTERAGIDRYNIGKVTVTCLTPVEGGVKSVQIRANCHVSADKRV